MGLLVNLVIIGIFQVSFDFKKKVEKGDTSILATEKQKKEMPIIKAIGIILMILNIIGTIFILCTQSLYSLYFEMIIVFITGMLALMTYVRYRISNNIEDCKPFDVILSVLLSIIVLVIIII